MGKSTGTVRPWWSKAPPPLYRSLPPGDIALCDSLEFLRSLKRGCADVIFLDPPFNLGKSYGAYGPDADKLREGEYAAFMRSILRQSCRILKKGGALYLYHIPRWAMRFGSLLSRRLHFRHWIVVSMKNGFVRPQHLYPAHYAMLYFTKGTPGAFTRPKIPPLRCRHCNNYVRDYGGYERFVRNGINISDVWDDLSPVRHKKYKHRHSNELPVEIPRRAVEISGRPGGVFVDPFAGSGTAILAAVEQHMSFVACDRVRECCKLVESRLGQSSGISVKGKGHDHGG